jgi:hypothetical protein
MSARRGTIRQPYSWLGAGALTLGMGVAMVSGTAVACADTASPDPAPASDTTPDAPAATAPGHRGAPVRVARPSGATARPAATVARQNRLALPAATADSTPVAVPAPAAVLAPARTTPVRPPAAASRRPASTSAAPAAIAPFPESPPSPFLPATPIVPGAHVRLSLQEISQAQSTLTQVTFGSGNLLAGVASVVPQLFLAEASLSLNAWGTVMPATQNLVAATAGIPVLQQIAQATLLAAMTLPSFAGIGFAGASLFMPVVSALGATTTEVTDLITQASQNGTVYAIVPVTVKANTEPTINVKVNGGPATPVLVDTGSSGLLVTRDYVGSANLGAPTGSGQVQFGGDTSTFRYTAYNAPVDFGNGALTGPTTIFIVDEADAAAYKAFLQPAGVVGILGTGADTNGPIRYVGGNPVSDPIPNSVLPGELSDGYLLYQDLFFGLLGGVMILGPNPFPTRVSVPGAGYALLQASVNGGAQQAVTSIIDSGGVYGTLPNTLPGVSGAVGSDAPAGTRINVYTPDGLTLLYTYTTGSNGPTIVNGTTEPMNTGNIAFSQGPVYVNYGAPGGYGSTDFTIW